MKERLTGADNTFDPGTEAPQTSNAASLRRGRTRRPQGALPGIPNASGIPPPTVSSTTGRQTKTCKGGLGRCQVNARRTNSSNMGTVKSMTP